MTLQQIERALDAAQLGHLVTSITHMPGRPKEVELIIFRRRFYVRSVGEALRTVKRFGLSQG